MSASLVGSEMCIRDSFYPLLSEGSSGTFASLAIRDSNRQRFGAAFRTTPVSYTHLTLPTICSV
eukprot:5295974-Alexandrium_andersonii.AAC.1